MSMSGVDVDNCVQAEYNEMKLRKTNKFMIFKIENKKLITIDEASGPGETETREADSEQFSVLKSKLPGDEPRYVLYDFGFTDGEGRKLSKLGFLFWCPDNSKIALKMIYASSKDALKKLFTGLQVEFQANDLGDLDYTEYANEIEKKK